MTKKIILIFIILITVQSNAETLFSFINSIVTTTEAYSICPDAGPTEEICVSPKPNMYIYDLKYGGRGATGNHMIFTENKLEHTLPAGWYEGKTATLDSKLFSPGNYDIALTLFGVPGFPLVAGGGLSECSYGTVVTPVPLNARCKITTPHYIYTQPDIYGVRTNECAIPSATTTVNSNKCWLKVGSGTYLAGPSSLPMCQLKVDATGLITSDCLAPKHVAGSTDSYFYSAAYNGKSRICNYSEAGATNTASCYVPADKTYFKVTNACVIDAANSVSCDVLTGDYPYTELYGGRNTTCDAVSNTSNCWFSSANKSSGIGSNLIDTNIKTGVNIFGVAGLYDGIPTDWGTGAPKNNGVVKGSYKDESYCGLDKKWTKLSGCQPNTAHRLVPIISTDHDGELSSFFVDRAYWGSVECGLTGTLDTRMSDCVTKINTALSSSSIVATYRNTAVWNSNGSMGNSGFGIWKLVSRVNATGVGMVEVWRDENTKLFWSSRVSENINWCRASGSSNNLKFPDLAENDLSNICNLQSNQEQVVSQNIISACFEDTGFSDSHSDIKPFTHGTVPSGKSAGKAGIHSTSTQKIFWRLPTIYDYRIANYNGMRFVLPDMTGVNANDEWTATINSLDRKKAWTFQSGSGQKLSKARNLKFSARCIGRGF